jgi:cytochrome c551/c552
MSRSAERRAAPARLRGALAIVLAMGCAAAGGAGTGGAGTGWAGAPAAAARPAEPRPWSGLGRPATAAELRAWDIDVRPDFRGLPPGSGSVEQGMVVWEAKCASCHGVFGESTEVFAPIVGGTTARDIETGRVASLARPDYPQRTTMMKLSQISTLWDYINRAMPWNAPKSLKVDEVYAVTAYILNLADVVPADFTLSDRSMAQVQARLPNRDGKLFWDGLWDVRGKGDVANIACMQACAGEVAVTSSLPPHARDSHGQLAAQHRLVGGVRGADTSRPPADDAARLAAQAALASMRGPATGATPTAPAAAAGSAPASTAGTAPASTAGSATAPAAGPATTLAGAVRPPAERARDAGCLACHDLSSRGLGPALRAVAERYRGDAGAQERLVGKVLAGGQGAWGPVPMPAQPALAADEAAALVRWILAGAD